MIHSKCIQKAMKKIGFTNIESDIFDVFQSYNAICNDINVNAQLYIIFQHFAASDVIWESKGYMTSSI